MTSFAQCQSLVFPLFTVPAAEGNALPAPRTRQALLTPIRLFQPPSTYSPSPGMSTAGPGGGPGLSPPVRRGRRGLMSFSADPRLPPGKSLWCLSLPAPRSGNSPTAQPARPAWPGPGTHLVSSFLSLGWADVRLEAQPGSGRRWLGEADSGRAMAAREGTRHALSSGGAWSVWGL